MTSKEYIDSGILEQYVMGMLDAGERAEVEKMAAQDPRIRGEMNAINDILEKYALENAIQPSPVIKPFLMAIIDYSERIKKGELVSCPPLLDEKSVPEDYSQWLNQPDLQPDADSDDVCAKIIAYTPDMVTAIVWINEEAPGEIHHDEHERFLILEGSCDIIVGDKINHLVPGDYFEIPLHENHMVKVTSSIPCKVILQRVAA